MHIAFLIKSAKSDTPQLEMHTFGMSARLIKRVTFSTINCGNRCVNSHLCTSILPIEFGRFSLIEKNALVILAPC
jgi:hypothetical protein